MKSLTLGLLLVVVGANGAYADDMKMPVNASQLEWAPAPNSVPEGAQIAVLSGDPSKDGLYVVRLKLPAGFKVPAHYHPATEMITVISGEFHLGMGDKLDEEKGMLLTAGGFAEAPARMNHYAWTSGPTVVQIHGQGPFAITYVNPADDPRSKPQAAK
jgi:anti-sigma factor ChrR (cupin superfamily)